MIPPRSSRRAAPSAPAAATLAVALAGLVFPAACKMSMAPVVATDSQQACLGGSAEWTLQIVDQRADKKQVADVEGPIRESLVRSLPGCRWSSGAGAPTITIEVHRFRVVFDGSWDAYAEWSVIVRDRDGRTLTEFQADSEANRPNYRGSDNEKAAMQKALDEAIRRTLAGLRSVSASG